jgi:tetratricopeptide (TPR) repeat protein
MQEQSRWAAENPKSAVSGNLLNEEASATRYFGRMSSARRLVDHAAALAQSSGWSGQAAADKSNEAFDESLIGNADFARDAARQALAFNSGDAASPATVKAALAFAFTGDLTTAEKLADQMSAEWPEGSMEDFELPCIRAAIAIGQSQPADAIRILLTPSKYELAAGNMFASYLRGLAYLQVGQGQQAATEFQRVIEHPGIVGISLIGALARLQLARAQEMMGDKEAARKSYQDFLTLWKEADPDIPIYQQAKAEYAKLKS